jgi:protein disulfide-isomerase A1
MKHILLLALLALSAWTAFASDVIVLTNDNFDEEIAKHELLLVEFYAPWCGHCKHLAPEYETAATELKASGLHIAKVDADDAQNRPLASRFEIRGFPTLKLFRNGKPSEYTGGRTADTIVSWMKKQSLPAISTLNNADELKTFSSSDRVVVVGFFDNRDSAEYQTFKTVANQLRDNFIFGEVVGQADLNKENGVDGSAGVVLFKQFDEGKNVLAKADFATLAQFVAVNSVPLIDEIGPENYKKYVEGGLPLAYLFVDLTVDGQKEENIAKIQDIAKATKGKINWVYIDWAKYAKHSERLGLSGTKVPSVAIEKPQEGTHWAFDETADITSATIQSWVDAFLAGTLKSTIKSEPIPETNDAPVTILVANNFEQIVKDTSKDVLVEFYAPWCGHCKTLAPIWEQLGQTFQGTNVVIAKIDATANDVDASYKVQGFPTIKFFPANNKDAVLEYEGDRSLDDLIKFIKTNAATKFDVKAPAAEHDDHEHDEL